MSLLSEHEVSGRLICFKHCPDYVFLRVNDDDTGWLVGRYYTLRSHITYKPCYHHLGTAIHSYIIRHPHADQKEEALFSLRRVIAFLGPVERGPSQRLGVANVWDSQITVLVR